MKKFFSILIFVLMLFVFVVDLYGAITGAIDVKNQYAAWEASGESGHALLGVGIDILVIGVGFFTVLGVILSLISFGIAQNRVIRIVSALTCPMFFVPVMVSISILSS